MEERSDGFRPVLGGVTVLFEEAKKLDKDL